MRTKVLLGVAVALMLVVSVATIGSNMGFKISIPLTVGYDNYVGIPYYNSYTDANSVLTDIGANAVTVNRWDNTLGGLQTWNGVRGDNFAITPGEAYIVIVSATTNWIVVGSHNPGLAVPLTINYDNYVSVPYHTTATNAGTLWSQIPDCATVNRWDNTLGGLQTWNGVRGDNFPLTPGEGLIIIVNSSSASWAPAHY